MLKVLLILCLWQGMPVHQQSKTEELNVASGEKNQIVPPAPATIKNPPACDSCTKKTEKGEYDPTVWRTAEKWAVGTTLAYTLVSFLALLAIKNQSNTMGQQISLSVNQKRPRLRLKLEDFNSIINGVPDVRMNITNIGGSKAIFGMCLAGVSVSRNTSQPKSLAGNFPMTISNSILKSEAAWEELVLPAPSDMPLYPADFDKTKPYVIHVYGNIVFRDMLFDDTWFRPFHYIWINFGEKLWFPDRRSMATGYWSPQIEEEDKRKPKPSKWKTWFTPLQKAWRWLEKISDEN